MNPHRILPAALVSGLAFSWMVQSPGLFLLSMLGLALFLIRGIWGAVSNALSAWHRRRVWADRPTFALRGTTLTMLHKETAIREKPLADLEHVRIITTDHGPYAGDLLLVLMFQDGSVWNVPGENPAYPGFYQALRQALPLDDDQAMRAAFSTADGLFPLWDKETPGTTMSKEA